MRPLLAQSPQNDTLGGTPFGQSAVAAERQTELHTTSNDRNNILSKQMTMQPAKLASLQPIAEEAEESLTVPAHQATPTPSALSTPN